MQFLEKQWKMLERAENSISNIKLITKYKRTNQLVLEPNYHVTKYFSESVLAIEMKKPIYIVECQH